MNGPSCVRIPLRSSAILNFEDDDKIFFILSKSAILHPCEIGDPKGVSIYRQYFDQLNIEGFDFSNRFKCSDVNNFGNLQIYL